MKIEIKTKSVIDLDIPEGNVVCFQYFNCLSKPDYIAVVKWPESEGDDQHAIINFSMGFCAIHYGLGRECCIRRAIEHLSSSEILSIRVCDINKQMLTDIIAPILSL